MSLVTDLASYGLTMLMGYDPVICVIAVLGVSGLVWVALS